MLGAIWEFLERNRDGQPAETPKKWLALVQWTQVDGQTPLHLAAAASGNAARMAGFLTRTLPKEQVGSVSLINFQDVRGRAPLYVAAMAGNSETITSLLHAGANTKLVDSRGRTALRIAIDRGHEKDIVGKIKATGAMGRTTPRQVGKRGRRSSPGAQTGLEHGCVVRIGTRLQHPMQDRRSGQRDGTNILWRDDGCLVMAKKHKELQSSKYVRVRELVEFCLVDTGTQVSIYSGRWMLLVA